MRVLVIVDAQVDFVNGAGFSGSAVRDSSYA